MVNSIDQSNKIYSLVIEDFFKLNVNYRSIDVLRTELEKESPDFYYVIENDKEALETFSKIKSDEQRKLLVVICNKTRMRIQLNYLKKILGDIFKYPNKLEEYLIADFIRNNASSQIIYPELTDNIRYSIFDEKNIVLDKKNNENFWQNFHSNFPNSKGALSLTKIGYNYRKESALVHLELEEDILSGKGVFYFLRKPNSEWKIIENSTSWEY